MFDRVQDRFTLENNAAVMSDLLAIFGSTDSDAEVVAKIAAYHPDRVTVLVEVGGADLMADDSGEGDALRNRLARLMAAIERLTGATVVGLAGDRSQLLGWRFDREVTAPLQIAA